MLCVLKLRERQILFPDSLFHLEASVGFGDQRYIQICSDLAQRIIPGEWTVIYSKDIKGLPRQEDGNACGIFMLMYALYIALGADFDFTTGDMDTIRTWWCLLLLSGHSVVRFAQKRKYEDPIIIADKDKEEAKRPRTIPPQQSERHETGLHDMGRSRLQPYSLVERASPLRPTPPILQFKVIRSRLSDRGPPHPAYMQLNMFENHMKIIVCKER
ncbi:uncharacterized protein LOC120560800 [Perca fluviatilis]|nr:uncharacterized protein LOC120560800 [Perca fluviatilis]